MGIEAKGECIEIAGVAVRFLPAYNAFVEEALAEAQTLDYAGTPARVLRPELRSE